VTSRQQCPFEHSDAAYVLGALSRDEREAYAVHLRDCASCRASVAELERLPALLDRVPMNVAMSLGDREGGDGADSSAEPPEGLLEGVLLRAKGAARQRRRFRARVAAAAIGAAAAAAAAVFAFWPSTDPTPAPSLSAASQSIELSALRSGPMQVEAALRDVAWGTKIELTCTYAVAGDADRYERSSRYALVIRDNLGNDEQVATWGAVPGRQVKIQAATSVSLESIAVLEVRGPDGTPLLRAER
jgi:hypothetical protein